MTLDDIVLLSRINKRPDDDTLVSIILKECPYLRYEAKPLTMLHYECTSVEKKWIRKYVIHWHRYDAVDVSRLVRALKTLC
jgi:hypothetical protein